MCFNLGIVATDVARRFGWHFSADVLQWLAIGLGFACIAAGVVAYRLSRAQARRDVDEMMPPIYRG